MAFESDVCAVRGKKILPLLLTFMQPVEMGRVLSSTSSPQAIWYLLIGTLQTSSQLEQAVRDPLYETDFLCG